MQSAYVQGGNDPTHKMSMPSTVLPAFTSVTLLFRRTFPAGSTAKELFMVELVRCVGLTVALFSMQALFLFTLTFTETCDQRNTLPGDESDLPFNLFRLLLLIYILDIVIIIIRITVDDHPFLSFPGRSRNNSILL
jgi:amino acid permease